MALPSLWLFTTPEGMPLEILHGACPERYEILRFPFSILRALAYRNDRKRKVLNDTGNFEKD